MSIIDSIKGNLRYALGLRGFLAVTLEREEAVRMLRQQLQGRDQAFLRVLELGIYANPRSPYRKLLLHAGFQIDDVRSLLRDHGLEGALSHLHDAGVYVTLDEFKGRAPVRRAGLEFSVSEQDFDNPLLEAHYEGRTGGSRSPGSRLLLDFDFFAYEAATLLGYLHANDVADRPIVVWRAAPPASDGLRAIFRFARLGRMPVKWFSPNTPSWQVEGLRARIFMSYTILMSRLFGRPVPRPEHVERSEVARIARWLAAAVSRGSPALVNGNASQATRICLAAEEAGVDITDTVFLAGGEPYTDGKAAVLERVGARGIPAYAMQEVGTVSFACGAPTSPDDMHLLSDKLAAVTRPRQVGSGLVVQELLYTSLLPSTPKLMLNVESGDYGIVEERQCDCLWQSLGFTTHLSGVRSYEKLTSEGVTFMGSMLFELLEEALPGRFGGSPTDYQLVEEEEDGLPRVTVVVSPQIGPLDDETILAAVTETLGSASNAGRLMVDQWRQGGTLRVERREPYATKGSKILPLHVLPAASGGTT